MKSSSLFSELRCTNGGCSQRRKQGTLQVAPGSERDPVLNCPSCGRKIPWRQGFKARYGVTASILYAAFSAGVMLFLIRFPLNPTIRLLVNLPFLLLLGSAIRTWVRYGRKVSEVKGKIQQGELGLFEKEALPADWSQSRAKLEEALAAIPKAKELLLGDLRALDKRLADAQARLASLQKLTTPEAEAKIQEDIKEQKSKIEEAKSARAREIHQETLQNLEERLVELSSLRQREEELRASLSAATVFLDNLRIRLASLRELAGGQIEKEAQALALDLKGRLSELETLLA